MCVHACRFPCIFYFVMLCIDVLYVYCMHIRVCIYVYVHLYLCIYMYVHLCTYMLVSMYVLLHTFVCINVIYVIVIYLLAAIKSRFSLIEVQILAFDSGLNMVSEKKICLQISNKFCHDVLRYEIFLFRQLDPSYL